MTFSELRLSAPLIRAVEDKNYVTPTPIQERAIPVALTGGDMIGIAQTGTGKTAAFSIPIIEQLIAVRPQRRSIRALIVTPTRELAIQIDECMREYSRYTPLRTCVIFGGVKQQAQVNRLRQGVDILIATPGRLLDLVAQGHVSLDMVSHFVLDEADRMLDMGFIHDINRIIPLLPTKRQTLLFSATMPKTIVNLTKKILHNARKVEATPESSVVDTIEQQMYMVEKRDKAALLVRVLSEREHISALVFSRTKHGADKISRKLRQFGIACDAIHGNKSQNARQKALSDFKSGKCRVIVATDIAARGIDISDLQLVINYDMPDVAETYVHRIGRTGRAGNKGTALSFCANEEHDMLHDIQRLIGRDIRRVKAAV